jgi:hypothetical protein
MKEDDLVIEIGKGYKPIDGWEKHVIDIKLNKHLKEPTVSLDKFTSDLSHGKKLPHKQLEENSKPDEFFITENTSFLDVANKIANVHKIADCMVTFNFNYYLMITLTYLGRKQLCCNTHLRIEYKFCPFCGVDVKMV